MVAEILRRAARNVIDGTDPDGFIDTAAEQLNALAVDEVMARTFAKIAGCDSKYGRDLVIALHEAARLAEERK